MPLALESLCALGKPLKAEALLLARVLSTAVLTLLNEALFESITRSMGINR
jgi:hypothetical protein